MPRPKRCRRVCSEPEYSCFEPEGVTNPEVVLFYAFTRKIPIFME